MCYIQFDSEVTRTLLMSHCATYIRLMDSWSEHHEAGESVIHTAPHREESTHRRQLDVK